MSAFDNKPKEMKPEVKTEKVEEVIKPVQSSEPQLNILRSEKDARIVDHMRSQPKTLEEVEAIVVQERDEIRNQLSLPDEIEPYTKRFAFCWIFNDRAGRGIDEACTLYHWVLCNRTHFPEIAEKAPHIFSANGAIERGDNILAFRTKKIDEEMRRTPGIESSQRIKARIEAHANDSRYYVPQSDSEDMEIDERTGKHTKSPVVGV